MTGMRKEVLSRKIAEAKERLTGGRPKAGDALLMHQTPDSVANYIDNIKMAMEIGPHMVLGGGVFPSGDSFRELPNDRSPKGIQWTDTEDGRVIDTAVAARAHAIATDNFRDFTSYNDDILAQGRVHIRRTAEHNILILSLDEIAGFLSRGIPPEMEEAVLAIVMQHALGADTPRENPPAPAAGDCGV